MFRRREFLQHSLLTSMLYAAGSTPRMTRDAHAAFARVQDRVLVNVMLAGGPDFRHVFPPAWTSANGSYGRRFWSSRWQSYRIQNNAQAWQKHWDNNFYHVSHNGVKFGILKKCDWLFRQWKAGNVALICNTVGATTRDHEHAILVMDQGNLDTGPNDFERSGWGGRLASAASGNVVSLSYIPRPFCNGLHPSGDITQYDNGNLLGASDTRTLGLYEPNDNPEWDQPTQMSRALKHYYRALRAEMSPDDTAWRFVEHEKKLRAFGRLMRTRLRDLPEPAALQRLYHRQSKDKLNNEAFGLQLRSLYDSLAASDIFNMRVASLDYPSWDSHDDQQKQIEPQLYDVFGKDRGLDRLWKALPKQAKNKVVFVIAGEFGRQLVANGGLGTDHGRGNTVLLIGRGVKGGVYGDMFPDSELSRWNDESADINGLTELDHVFGAACDWVQPGSSNVVFPNKASRALESGVNPASLFET